MSKAAATATATSVSFATSNQRRQRARPSGEDSCSDKRVLSDREGERSQGDEDGGSEERVRREYNSKQGVREVKHGSDDGERGQGVDLDEHDRQGSAERDRHVEEQVRGDDSKTKTTVVTKAQ